MKARYYIGVALCTLFAIPSFATGPRVLLLRCAIDRDPGDVVATYTGIARVEFLDPAHYYASWVWGNVWTSNGEISRSPYFGLTTPSDPEIDSQVDFYLDPRGSCTTGFIDGQNEDIDPIESQSSQLCWQQYVCRLSVLVDSGGTLTQDGNMTGNYSCSACIELAAFANDGWDFAGFSGAVTSSNPVIQVCMNGRDQTEYVHFVRSAPPLPPSPPPGGPIDCPGGDCGDSFGSWEPLILDLNGDGVNTTGTNDLVWFDLNGDGTPDHITWTNSATMEGFLWVNLTGKNRVDNGSELFGIGTVLPNGSKATDGFQALAIYDELSQGGNGDHVINAQDDVWNKLRVWIDANHNGVCEPGEVFPLHKFGVESISLSAARTSLVDSSGNGHFLRGSYWRRINGVLQPFDIDGVTFQRQP